MKYSLRDMAIFAVMLLALIALVYVAAQAMGVPIPPWVLNVLGIVFIAVVVILAIKVVSGTGSGPL